MTTIYRRSTRLENKYTDENKQKVIKVISDIKCYLRMMDYYKHRNRKIYYFEKLTKYLLFNLNILYLDYSLIGKIWGLDNLAKMIIKRYKELLFEITNLYNDDLLSKQKSQHLTSITTKIINMNKNYLFSKTKYLFKTILPGDIIREIITKWI
jgi:hypothetical protein